ADTGSGQALPLLAFTLAELARGTRRGDSLSQQRYRDLGGGTRALTPQAGAALPPAPAATRRSPPPATSPPPHPPGRTPPHAAPGDRPARRRVAPAALPAPVAAELAAFTTARLLTTDTNNTDTTSTDAGSTDADSADAGSTNPDSTSSVSVSHESFLTTWPPLAEAITDTAAALRTRQEADPPATPRPHLWDATRPAAALAALHARPPRPRRRLIGGSPTGSGLTARVSHEPRTRAFLTASIRRARRRRRLLITVLSTLFVAALT